MRSSSWRAPTSSTQASLRASTRPKCRRSSSRVSARASTCSAAKQFISGWATAAGGRSAAASGWAGRRRSAASGRRPVCPLLDVAACVACLHRLLRLAQLRHLALHIHQLKRLAGRRHKHPAGRRRGKARWHTSFASMAAPPQLHLILILLQEANRKHVGLSGADLKSSEMPAPKCRLNCCTAVTATCPCATRPSCTTAVASTQSLPEARVRNPRLLPSAMPSCAAVLRLIRAGPARREAGHGVGRSMDRCGTGTKELELTLAIRMVDHMQLHRWQALWVDLQMGWRRRRHHGGGMSGVFSRANTRAHGSTCRSHSIQSISTTGRRAQGTQRNQLRASGCARPALKLIGGRGVQEGDIGN